VSTARRLLAISPTGLFSGAERVLQHYLAAARQRGWTVSCLAPPGTLFDTLTADGVNVVALPDLKLGDGPRPLAALTMMARWGEASRPIRRRAGTADVVLVNGLLALPAVRLARVHAPVCWLVHDVVVRRDLLAVARGSAGAVDLAIAVSDAAAALPRRLGMITVIARNGARWPVEPADSSATAPTPAPTSSPPIVGINAMLVPWKGHRVLLDAIAHVDGAVVELMGGQFPKDAEHVARLRQRADEADLAGRVHFLGHCADPLAQMRRWTLAVNASTDPEAAPLSVLEAMSLGLPVVATDHGGSPEVLGDAGLLVPPSDAAALARAITTLLGDADLRHRCAVAGRAAIADHYSLARTTEKMMALLEQAESR
jgi:glycosyltransferase involved in cell wall biosynthesis